MVAMDIYRAIAHIAPSLMCYGSQTQDAMSDPDQDTRHIALVGITGVGKSTLVNVLNGKEVAPVSNDVRPCTPQAKMYKVVEGGIKYCIWDTRGLNEASDIPTRVLQFFRLMPDAERELKTLLRGKNPKFNLVLLCVDAKKIKVSAQWKTYNLIHAAFCKRTLKVAVVATQIGERDFKDPELQEACRDAARKVDVVEFPELMEAVPKFEQIDDPSVKECKRKILDLIAKGCSGR